MRTDERLPCRSMDAASIGEGGDGTAVAVVGRGGCELGSGGASGRGEAAQSSGRRASVGRSGSRARSERGLLCARGVVDAGGAWWRGGLQEVRLDGGNVRHGHVERVTGVQGCGRVTGARCAAGVVRRDSGDVVWSYGWIDGCVA